MLGAVAGWHWGRTMAIDVHPEDGTLMVKVGEAAMMVLAVLILFRLGLREGLSWKPRLGTSVCCWYRTLLSLFRAAVHPAQCGMYLRGRWVIALKAAA